ncbi:DUF1566 domain-containing protein [Aeromonas hydrophila]|uniref:DUF1566 domain-containing protein n=1 Tax=Aeromonas hydrophila TaxID=644 RepID=UPI00057348E9|nr:DUF1566 domain-containing protein [Aeromonas hydrophila]KHN49526.1 hypothetical protein OI72_22050 [Aeromonas hydrophila]OFC42871.1 hypothetical protein BA189_22725 [Aeromonas hydrophila]
MNFVTNLKLRVFLKHAFIMILSCLALSVLGPVMAAVESNRTLAPIGRMPVASSVRISPAAPKVAQPVSVTWNYADADGDAQSNSVIAWLLNGAVVQGATATSFTPPRSANGQSLQVRITPRSVASADPVSGTAVTSTGAVVALPYPAPNSTMPTTTLYNWLQADAYCRGLSPAARLPTRAELQNIFISSTSATATGGQANFDMCDVHGWPLSGGRCGGPTGNVGYYWTSELSEAGGHYGVYMNTGNVTSGIHDASFTLVTCVR